MKFEIRSYDDSVKNGFTYFSGFGTDGSVSVGKFDRFAGYHYKTNPLRFVSRSEANEALNSLNVVEAREWNSDTIYKLMNNKTKRNWKICEIKEI